MPTIRVNVLLTIASALAIGCSDTGDDTGGPSRASRFAVATTVLDDTSAATSTTIFEIDVEGTITPQLTVPGYAAYPILELR